MDRAIFNLTKYSIFLYLHCTDTQTLQLSPAPPSVDASVTKHMADFLDNKYDKILHREKNTHAQTNTHAHTHTSALINVIEEQRRGKQNFCRKPEVAYPTIPRPRSHFTKITSWKGQWSSARRCFLIGLRG